MGRVRGRFVGSLELLLHASLIKPLNGELVEYVLLSEILDSLRPILAADRVRKAHGTNGTVR
jgi:hypothetical protein